MTVQVVFKKDFSSKNIIQKKRREERKTERERKRETLTANLWKHSPDSKYSQSA